MLDGMKKNTEGEKNLKDEEEHHNPNWFHGQIWEGFLFLVQEVVYLKLHFEH